MGKAGPRYACGLPQNKIPSIWVGPGDGEVCDACEEVIGAGQLLAEGISAVTKQGMQVHVECLYVWDPERDAAGADLRPS